ncbi:hypothetical protein ACHAPJ_009508 [Fusarium lateritium]
MATLAPPPEKHGVTIEDPPLRTQNHGHTDEPSNQMPASKAFFRVFTYGTSREYVLQAIGIIAAIASGVAMAMVNVVFGRFISLLSDLNTSGSVPEGFMAAVQTAALYFVYIGIVRFVATYVYASLFTYVAYHLTRNIRRTYLKAAFSQEIA